MNKRCIFVFFIFFAIFLMSCGSNNSKYIQSEPMVGGVRLAVVGDFGDKGSGADKVAQMIASWNVDAVITTGDNNYPKGAENTYKSSVEDRYGDYINKLKFFPSMGNHDWGYPTGDPAWKADEIPLLMHLPYLSGNRRYYNVSLGDSLVEIFVVDSDINEPDGRSADSVQGQWLNTVLSNSTATYKLVFMHEPPYSSCLFGDTEVISWPFREWGADAVFTGHCHFYERVMKDGFPYFVNGLGGGREVTEFKTITEGSIVRYLDNFGAQMIEVTPEKMVITFISIGEEVIDSYTILK